MIWTQRAVVVDTAEGLMMQDGSGMVFFGHRHKPIIVFAHRCGAVQKRDCATTRTNGMVIEKNAFCAIIATQARRTKRIIPHPTNETDEFLRGFL